MYREAGILKRAQNPCLFHKLVIGPRRQVGRSETQLVGAQARNQEELPPGRTWVGGVPEIGERGVSVCVCVCVCVCVTQDRSRANETTTQWWEHTLKMTTFNHPIARHQAPILWPDLFLVTMHKRKRLLDPKPR